MQTETEMLVGTIPDEVLLEEAIEFGLRALNGERMPSNYTDPISRWWNEMRRRHERAA
jgi:hypothetical protein